MSESVKVGGIGKNPAIDRINDLSSADVKDAAKTRLEQLILAVEGDYNDIYRRQVPLDFSKVNWKGKKE